MHSDVILQPEGFTPQFRRLIESLDLPPDLTGNLLTAEPASVLVSSRRGCLIIHLNATRLLKRQGLDSIREELARQLAPGLGLRIIWDVHYPAGAVKAGQYLDEHWPDLLEILPDYIDLAGLYLSVVRFGPGGNKPKIFLPNEMALSALKRKNGEEILSRLLAERLRDPVVVHFEVGDCGEAGRKQEALYRQRILSELERLHSEVGEASGEGIPAAGTAKASWRPLLGRKIAAPPVPIVNVTEEQDQVVVEGELVAFECKVLRTGRQLVLMDVYDQTSTLSARLFLDAGQKAPADLKPSAYVKLRGTVQIDKYSQDLCLLVRDIALGSKTVRRDLAPEKRVELHAHTQLSAMDALAGVEQLIRRAAEFGHAAVAVTDHGVAQAYPEAMAAAAKYKIKVLYGLEGYLIEDGADSPKNRRPYHISLLIAEPQGVKNLYRLVSEAHLHHFYRHPRIPRSLLQRYRDGLLLGTACEQGELFQRLLDGASEADLERVARGYDYLEIMPRANNRFLVREQRVPDEAALLDLNRRIYALGRRLGLPVVATGDVHFIEPGDEVFRSILQHGMGYEDAAQQAPLYFQTTEEMLKEFDYLGPEAAREVVIQAPAALAARVGDIQPLKTTFHPPVLPQAERELEQLALQRAEEMYGNPLPEIVARRLIREMTAINTHNFASLFLIARRLVRKSLEEGYLVGSRGSVGSSLTATLLGVTEVNPLPGHYRCPECHFFELDPERRIGADLPDRACPNCGADLDKDGFDIPFEVFMGFKGDKLPDIDLNFSGDYQATAHKYIEELFDRAHIFKAGTISTVADRIAYGFVKKYLEDHKLVLREAEVNRLTRGCTGVKKTTGQHPGGIMIVPEDLEIYDFTPIQHPADDRESRIITTHFDYHAIHDSLVKLDILGHDDPTSLRRLADLTGLDVQAIPLDDPETLKIFSGLQSLGVGIEEVGTSVGTLGIPEFGTEFVRQMLEVTRPTRFSELVRISGLSHGTDVWLNNAADLIKSKTATLSSVISARDDIMNYLIATGMDPALAFKIMESVRKGKGLMPEQEKKMLEFNVPKWYVESCKKIKYMFPKAHAVAYCLMSFRVAYFKVHYPAAFYVNYLTLNAEFFDAELVVGQGRNGVTAAIRQLREKTEATAKEKNTLVVLEVVREAFARGITFRPVSLLESDPAVFRLVEERELLPPLISLSGLGLTCAQRIAEERQKGQPFRSVEDLARRTGANKNVVEILTRHGCLGVLPKTDQVCLF